MKKYLLILGLVLGLNSCTGNKNFEVSAVNFTYKGHNYIVFEKGPVRSTSNYYMSIVHDPDCPCHKKELKE